MLFAFFIFYGKISYKIIGGNMKYLLVGEIVSTHGIKGDLKLYPLTDFAKVRFKKGRHFELYNEETNSIVKVTCFSFKTSSNFLVVHFDEITTPEQGIKISKLCC